MNGCFVTSSTASIRRASRRLACTRRSAFAPNYTIHSWKSEKRLIKEQRKLSRKENGSSNRRKQRRKVAVVHLKVANQRDDFLYKLSRELAEKYSMIVIEELRIQDMVKNHLIAKSFNDAGLSTFISMLEHKVSETGARLIKVPAAFTTQTCSRCGRVKEGDEKLGLGDREYHCPT